MSLHPTGGLVGTLSKAATDDPEGAAVLIDEAVSNWMLDELEKNADLVQPLVGTQLDRDVRFGKRAIGRAYVEQIVNGEYPDMSQMAEWAAGLEQYVDAVSKEWVIRQGKDGKQHRMYTRRDEKGRFSATIDVGPRARRDPTGYRAMNQVSPALRSKLVVDGGQPRWQDGDDDGVKGRMAAHQSQWEQAQDFAEQASQVWDGDTSKVNLVVTIVDAEGAGQGDEVVVPLKQAAKELNLGSKFNPLSDNILMVRLDSTDPGQAAKIAQFNAMGAVMGRIGATKGSWEEAFGMTGPEQSNVSRLWSRLTAGANVLRAVPGGDKAAKWAELVGSAGPEAEAALGPYVRQAAYRYRGTEKTPDKEILAAFDSPAMGEIRAMADADVTGRDMVRSMNVDLSSPKDVDPEVGAAAFRASRGATGDQMKMQINSDVLVNELARTMPEDSFTPELSRKSGHVLPSQGVIIDADGEVVSQAVGYADDHYLPFDLKNISRLRGGQYVRTRVNGGLTGEDIYASIQAGARMATVVSGSGVFTLEFDPQFRGARGNSDKARSMYTRYLKILDSVNGSNMYVQDLPGDQKVDLERRARAAGMNDAMVESVLNDARDAASYIPFEDTVDADVSVKGLWEAAGHMAANDPKFKNMSRPQQNQRVHDIFTEELEQAKSKTVKPLALNAEGYHAALQTLQQQFPYFIRSVSYEPLRDTDQQKGFFAARGLDQTHGQKQSTFRRDAGYVKPGGLRPAKTRTGFWQPDIGEPDLPKRAPETSGLERGGVPGQSAAGGAPTTGADAAPSAAAVTSQGMSRLGQKLAAGVGDRQKAAERSINELANSIAALPTVPTEFAGFKTEPWAEAKKEFSDPVMQLHWAMMSGPRIPEQLADPEGRALWSNPERVKTAFLRAYPSDLLKEDFEAGSIDESHFGGAKSAAEAVQWLQGQVKVIADSEALVDPLGGAPSGDVRMDGPNANKPFTFADMDIENSDQLRIYLNTAEGKRLSGLLDEIGVDENGQYRSVEDAANRVKARIGLLDRLIELNPEKARSADLMTPVGPKKIAAELGVDEGELVRTLGGSFSDFNTDVSDLRLRERQMQLQRAWTLATIERVVAQMEGGDAVPKERVLRRQDPAAAVGKASSSLRVAHPLSRQAVRVRMRKAAGMPLIP